MHHHHNIVNSINSQLLVASGNKKMNGVIEKFLPCTRAPGTAFSIVASRFVT